MLGVIENVKIQGKKIIRKIKIRQFSSVYWCSEFDDEYGNCIRYRYYINVDLTFIHLVACFAVKYEWHQLNMSIITLLLICIIIII